MRKNSQWANDESGKSETGRTVSPKTVDHELEEIFEKVQAPLENTYGQDL